MKNTGRVFAIFFLFLFARTQAQTFQAAFGDTSSDQAASVIATSDGGYILCGYKTDPANNRDAYLVKTNANGALQWSKTYFGSNADQAYDVMQLGGGSYVWAGYTQSFGAGGTDACLVKTDASGNVLWAKAYGGAINEGVYGMVRCSDGGFALAGSTGTYGAGGGDAYLIRTDSSGNMLWNGVYGGANLDLAYGISQTSDGGFILAGVTFSFGAGSYDVYVLRVSAGGTLLWSKTYGGSNVEFGYKVKQTIDGGFIIAATTESFGAGLSDAYLLKTDSLGTLLWSKTYGSFDFDESLSIGLTNDGGYILSGDANSYSGSFDALMIKTDTSGVPLWSRIYGGVADESLNAAFQTSDGGYGAAGFTRSYGAGNYDMFVLKTEPGGQGWCGDSLVTLVSAPAPSITTAPLTLSDTGGIQSSIVFNIGGGTTSTLVCSSGADVHENTATQSFISVAPNPSGGNFVLHSAENIRYLEVRNLLGEIVLGMNVNNTSANIGMESCKSGIYFYSAQMENGTRVSGKLVVQ
ncbi:MAG TPA: T9SS type A sorting domain-containing protein [Bacteroidia bacterium]|jgi:hypothetical protein